MSYKNVVLLVADTLRAKDLPSYNQESDLKIEFLEDKHSVSNYYSNSPWTVPAHSTLFTGNLPSEHGVTTENTYFDKENKVVSAFSENGYKTIGLTENPLVTPELGFGRYFDTYGKANTFKVGAKSWNKIWKKDVTYDGRKEKYKDFLKLLAKNRDLKSISALLDYLNSRNSEDYNPSGSIETVNQALKFLNDEEDTFLFLNLMPVHAPYTFNEKQREKYLGGCSKEEIEDFTQFDMMIEYLHSEQDVQNMFRKRHNAYKASISYLDSILEYFYENAPDNTLFLLLGDHGELIGEYEIDGTRVVNHHFGTFKELIEVPFYIYSKGEDVELKTEEGLYDHRSLHDLLLSLASGNVEMAAKEKVLSEYFGKAGFNRQNGQEIPEEFKNLFERKSFSLIDRGVKFDLTSDGDYLWSENSLTEKETLNLDQTPESLSNKAEILYRWRLE